MSFTEHQKQNKYSRRVFSQSHSKCQYNKSDLINIKCPIKIRLSKLQLRDRTPQPSHYDKKESIKKLLQLLDNKCYPNSMMPMFHTKTKKMLSKRNTVHLKKLSLNNSYVLTQINMLPKDKNTSDIYATPIKYLKMRNEIRVDIPYISYIE